MNTWQIKKKEKEKRYENAINAKEDQYSTESLLLSLVFEQDKLINKNNKLTKNPSSQSPLFFV